MKYGTNIDVVLKDSEGTAHYIYARVGDAKNHTYPNGIYQTGYPYPDGTNYVNTGKLGAPVEFIGPNRENDPRLIEDILNDLASGLEDYEIEEIIVYD